MSHNSYHCPYVEILGPPGVGKSTILKTVSGMWEPEASWTIDPSRKEGPWKNTNLDGVSSANYIHANREFVANLFKGMSQSALDLNSKDAAHKFFQAQALLKIFWKLDAASKILNDNTVMIVDEGFAQRCEFLLRYDLNCYKAKDILHAPQMARAYITVNLDPDSIVSRLRRRSKVTQLHRTLSETDIVKVTKASIERWDKMRQLCKEGGIPFLDIDATKEPFYNAQLVVDFAKGLSH